MNSLSQDLRYALRQLRKSPGFTLTVILTLALGIGANAAVFTMFDQVLLRMLPVRQPESLVRFQWTGGFSGSMSSFGGDSDNYFSYPAYKELRDHNQVFDGVLAADKAQVGISWHNQAENDEAEIVSGNYFQVLGLQPALGRLFTSQDDTQKNANPVTVVSYNFWRTHLGSARDIVGQTILVNGQTLTILGVAPANFDSAIGGYKPNLFIPVSMVSVAIPWRTPLDDLNNHQSAFLTLVARLKPGVTMPAAEASLQPLWHSLRAYELTLYKNHSERFKHNFLDTSRLKVIDDSRGFNPDRLNLQKPLAILMGMAGMLVLLCAVNVATLLLLRAANRAREMSMRYALGARRGRIISQLMIEGGLLGLLGSVAGLFLAPVVARVLVRIITNSDPGAEPYSASVDTRVLLFTLGISVVATLFFSIAPVFHFLKPDLTNSLRQNSGTLSKDSQRFRKLAVGAQIALSVLLLGGAGLFVRTLNNLRHEQVGFRTDHLVEFQLSPSDSGYGEDRSVEIVKTSIAALSQIPGVTSVAGNNDPELVGDSETSNYSIQGYKAAEDEKMNFEEPRITPAYFATIGQPLLAGREFTPADTKGQPKVAVVNMAFVKRFFGTPQNAIGRQIAEGSGNDIKYDITVVGVVGDTKHTDLRTKLGPAVYMPYLQQKHPTGLMIYLRTARAPETIQPAIRQTMRQLDSTLVVDNLRTMEAQIDNSTSDERALAFLAIGFASLALILAAVGLYGVLAYSTEQRTREIGVRLALGSPRSVIVMLVVREMALIAGIASVIALPAVVALARLFQSQLFGVTTFDPLTLVAAVFLTILMLSIAAAMPARRAAAVEPMQALRTE
ncbi:ABC transporter permease [Occallatibacter savannae]|uniref:ABC transporter permease n=1 Tax=Occallatibacter savannae TaxID=1002691 RepID=UPI000D6988C9|nr:ABC transporter permease [Occallatibacter savannae]